MFDLFGNSTVTQSALDFPTPLTEKYRPRTMSEFVGLAKPKALCAKLAARPFPSAWLFVGPSGTGKTSMAMALGEMIPAEIHHIGSQECDLATLERHVKTCQYVPMSGKKMHLIIVDEADQMTPAAQLYLICSKAVRLSTARLGASSQPKRTLTTMNETERKEYFQQVGACEKCGSTPCSCAEDKAICLCGNSTGDDGLCLDRDCICRPENDGRDLALTDLFGPVIHSYTRREAIADGVLVDLGTFSFRKDLTILQEAGIKYPTAITRAAYNRTIQEEGRELPPAQDLSGRMWDVCYMMAHAARRSAGPELAFKLHVWNWTADGKRTKHELVTLKAICGPGDDAEPVITIMLPDED